MVRILINDLENILYLIIFDRREPRDLKYKGLYKVRIIPPRGLRLPVLPMKLDERLLFTLCHRCATEFRKKNTKCQHKCMHTDDQRAFTGTYTDIELGKALEKGYKVRNLLYILLMYIYYFRSIDFGELGIMRSGAIKYSRNI